MKLEFKHLAPYLPHNIEFLDNGKPETIIGWKDDRIYIDDCHKSGYCRIDEINTLLLRPLSDLTEEIEVNGEVFVPYDTPVFVRHRMNSLHPKNINIVGMSYWCVEKLFEWHFDVFRLIDEGLAVEIKNVKLNKEPMCGVGEKNRN